MRRGILSRSLGLGTGLLWSPSMGQGARPPATLLTWITWLGMLLLAALGLFAVRGAVDKAHVTLILLLVVLGGSASGGRALGVTISILSFFVFDWFFLPPYGTLVIRNPLDWLVLVTFLVTSLVAAELLYRARAERIAEERVAALREADRLKDALLASVSHDLRTPLTTIKALAHELSDGRDERATIIEEQADRLNRFVSDLLDAARLSSGTFPLDVQLNAVDDLIGATVQQFAGRPDRDRIHASLERPDDLLVGRFDFVQALRIVTNLVENALKYAPVDTAVDLTAGRDNAVIVIRVADRGLGVAEGERDRIFDAFYRPANMSPDAGSAGLGLSIAHQLAALQQGELRYLPRPGGGSVFEVRLPAA